jgi:hypothetical protein
MLESCFHDQSRSSVDCRVPLLVGILHRRGHGGFIWREILALPGGPMFVSRTERVLSAKSNIWSHRLDGPVMTRNGRLPRSEFAAAGAEVQHAVTL